MKRFQHLGPCAIVALIAALATGTACAHSASDAYMTLEADKRTGSGTEPSTVLHGQWDIALRDLNFVLKLDDDGNGNITWAELRKHQAAIAKYAFEHMTVSSEGRACTITPTRQLVDNHADGAYAALFFDIACGAKASHITLDYRLFFALDPSHRGIFVLRSGSNTATSLLSPENARIDLKL